MSDFLSGFLEVAKNPYASRVSDGVEAGDVSSFIDSGSYILNALLSGDIYGGLPANKITAFAGESATGKTFFVLGCCKQFLEDNQDGGIVYFESESAISKDMIESRDIDSKRIIILPVATVQEFRTQAVKILEKHLEIPEKQRPPMMMCLDSLGMLSTSKEVEDTAEGKDTRDMTRAQVIRGAFRILTLKLGKAKVPMLVTNHTYQEMGLFPVKKMGGGLGLRFAADIICFLSKKKEKDGSEVIGNIIHVLNNKNRFTKENMVVDVLLTYKTGLSRYFGMLDLAIKYNIFQSVSTRIVLPDGSKTFSKTINGNPTKYFTEDILNQINKHVYNDFMYGATEHDVDDTHVEECND
jgi:RecA/RadA recombinase